MYGAAEDLPDTIELTAIDAARNIHRRYAVVASIDLFGAIIVKTCWGRIGAQGQAKVLSCEGRDYLSIKLDDPSFAAPVYASLTETDDGTFALIWSR